MVIVGAALLAGLLAAFYPAIFLSQLKPLTIIRGALFNPRENEWIRRLLVVFQFTLSILFIIGFVVINLQISYIQHKELGYDREHVVRFVSHGVDHKQQDILTNELRQIPGVVSTSKMMGDFLWGNDNNSGFSWKGEDWEAHYLFLSPKIGYNVIETLGLEIIDGRSFSKEKNDRHSKVLLNESAVEMMGLENPVGTILNRGSNETREIIGVVKDFHYGSLHQRIKPLIFRFREHGDDFLVRVEGGAMQETLAKIGQVYRDHHPKYIFDYSFLDADYKALYEAEQRVTSLSNLAVIFAIITSCLGLFGLTTFVAEKKRKEIGVRKILGASAISIFRMLTLSFTLNILIAAAFAFPLGYIFSNEWLQGYSYAAPLHWWIFATSGLVALVIAWLTMSIHTSQIIKVNPVDCLRDE